MPTQADHLRQAWHNEQFCSQFDTASTPFLDWVVTGLFYTALHYVDAYLDTKGHHPRVHGKAKDPRDSREHWLLNLPEFSNIYGDYRDLQDSSADARYGLRGAGLRTFSAWEVTGLRDHQLSNVKRAVVQLLGTP